MATGYDRRTLLSTQDKYLELVSIPPRKHTIGSRWVFKIKIKSNWSTEFYKIHLISKEFSQKSCMDYEETFALMTKMTTLRILIVVSSVCQWHISQMGVKNSFLNGGFHDEVYMVPPSSVYHNHGEVWKLKKVIYDLKKAPQAWFEKFTVVITYLVFHSSDHDSTLFVKTTFHALILLSL